MKWHSQKISLVEMMMFGWMSGKYNQGSNKNENVRGKLVVTLIEDQIGETCVKWFRDVQRMTIDAV